MKFTTQRKNYEEIIQLEDITPYQLDVFQWLLGYHIKIGDKFVNPLRKDTNPDCWLEWNNNVLRLIDFGDYYNGTGEFHNKDCVQLTQYKYHCDFKLALQIIFYECLQKKHNLQPKYNLIQSKRKVSFKLKAELRKWSKFDKKFWNGSTGITSEQLELENCFAVKNYWYTNKEGQYIKMKTKSPTFINYINSRSKIYIPKTRTFLTNLKATDIGGKKDIPFELTEPKILFIVSNLKSCLCMNNIYYNCRFLPNEGLYLSNEYIKQLDEQYDYIFFLLDNNQPGINASNKLQKQWLETTGNNKGIACNFPVEYYKLSYENAFNQMKLVEDPYDVCKKWDLTKLDKEVIKIINQHI